MSTLDDDEALRWPGGPIAALVAAAVVAVVGWILVGVAVPIVVAILAAIVGGALVAARRANRSGPAADYDQTDSVPKQPAHADRPLGDTREAHDEIGARDVPPDSPVREDAERRAERESGDRSGTFRGVDDPDG